MSKLDILNLKGEKVKDTKLNDNVFGVEPNDSVIYDAVVLYNASQRQGTHSTKTRSEVSGGGRDKKELVMQDKVVSELYNGVMVE